MYTKSISINELLYEFKNYNDNIKSFRILYDTVSTFGLGCFIIKNNDKTLKRLNITVSNELKKNVMETYERDITYSTDFISDVITLREPHRYWKVRFIKNLNSLKIKKFEYTDNISPNASDYYTLNFPLSDEDVFNLSLILDCDYLPYINEICYTCFDLSKKAVDFHNKKFMEEYVSIL